MNGLLCIEYRIICYTIHINLLIKIMLINTQNVHSLIDQIIQRTSALRGTTVALKCCIDWIESAKKIWFAILSIMSIFKIVSKLVHIIMYDHHIDLDISIENIELFLFLGYVSMCIFFLCSTHKNTHTHTHKCKYTYTLTNANTHTHTRKLTNANARAQILTNSHTHTISNTHAHASAHKHIHKQVHTLAHTRNCWSINFALGRPGKLF